MTLRKIAIFPNTEYDPEYSYTKQAVRVLSKSGILSVISSAAKPFFADDFSSVQFFDESDDMMEAADAILVLGGDGTVLEAAHLTAGTGTPIVGINIGNLGYLAEIHAVFALKIGGFYCCALCQRCHSFFGKGRAYVVTLLVLFGKAKGVIDELLFGKVEFLCDEFQTARMIVVTVREHNSIACANVDSHLGGVFDNDIRVSRVEKYAVAAALDVGGKSRLAEEIFVDVGVIVN